MRLEKRGSKAILECSALQRFGSGALGEFRAFRDTAVTPVQDPDRCLATHSKADADSAMVWVAGALISA